MIVTFGLPKRKWLVWAAATLGTAMVLSAAVSIIYKHPQDVLWVVATAALLTAAILGFELRRVRRAKGLADLTIMAKSRFMANISQDIRTPMDGIVGMTDLLLLSGLTNRQREYAETVQTSAGALLKMLNEMLDYSRIVDGRVPFTNSDFELHELIDNVVERYAPAAFEKRIELTCHIAPNVPEVVCGDPSRLQQVVEQLVGNAVKFTAHGAVCVSIRWLGDVDAEHLIQIEVRDTGVGIRPEDRSRVFDSYAAVRPGKRQRVGGGIGLAIARQIVTRARGTIDFESEPGRGSTFWVLLPFGRCSINLPVEGKSSALAGKRIVIASGLKCFSRTALDYCHYFGMETIEVDSPDRLKEVLRGKRDVHLVVVDDEIARSTSEPLRGQRALVVQTSATRAPDGYTVLRRPVRRRTFEQTLLKLLDEQPAGAEQPADSLKPV